jgi:hypothetical protein
MDVDDLVFVPPDKVGRQDFHEPRQHDINNFVLLQQFERGLLGLGTILPVHLNERQLVFPG